MSIPSPINQSLVTYVSLGTLNLDHQGVRKFIEQQPLEMVSIPYLAISSHIEPKPQFLELPQSVQKLIAA